LVDLGVAEGKGIALVVVVRAVLRIGVRRLDAETGGEALGSAERDPPIAAPGARLDGRQGADPIGPVAETRGPRGTELRGVAVHEARQVRRVRPVVPDQESRISEDL